MPLSTSVKAFLVWILSFMNQDKPLPTTKANSGKVNFHFAGNKTEEGSRGLIFQLPFCKSKLYVNLECQIKQGDLSQSFITVVITGAA